MTDFYLKFASEEEARTVLYTVTPAVLDEESNVVSEETVKPNYANIDTLGVLYNNDAVIGADGEIITPATPLVGWHVNIRLVDGEAGTDLEAFRVTPEPSTPVRVWA